MHKVNPVIGFCIAIALGLLGWAVIIGGTALLITEWPS